MSIELSVVIPVFNGAKTIESLVDKVQEHLQGEVLRGEDLEIILVNDGSADDSEAVCEQIARSRRGVKFISLRRNFGEHNAVMCGLNYAAGSYAVIIDDDFQNPPSEIGKLLEKAREGYDAVYSQYKIKQHSAYRNLLSWVNDRMATLLLSKPANLYLSSFKIIRLEVVEEIIKYRGPFPYIDGLLLRTTRNIGTVITEHHKRRDGKSTYTLRKLVRLHFNMFFNFSMMPLRALTALGICSFVLGVLLSLVVIIEKLENSTIPLGWASTMVAILILSGLQMVFLGMIGEFLGKNYLDQNGTPQWVVKKIIDTH